jgi:transposase
MDLHTIGIDLGKTVFHLVGLNLRGEVVVRKKFSRTQLLRFTANVHVELMDPQPYPNGRFARVHDPEGNPIELWQPKVPDTKG